MSIIGGIVIFLIGIYLFQELGFYDDEDKLMYCIGGMVIIGGCGVSLGFEPMAAGGVGFLVGYLVYNSNH